MRIEKLDSAAVSKIIDEAAQLGIPHVSFSGGEPLLYFDEIMKHVQQARGNGISSSLVTNGVWCNAKESTESKIRLLKDAGLTSLEISYDNFHREAGAKVEHIKTIITECKKQGIGVGVKRVKGPTKNKDRFIIEKELRGFKEIGCEFQVVDLSPSGAASVNFSPTDYRYAKVPIEKITECEGIGTIVTYLANGTLMPCCADPLVDMDRDHDCTLLRLGNIYEDKLEVGIKRLKNNLYLSILAILGPIGFKLLAEEYPNHIAWPEVLRSTCDFCVFAAGSDEFGEWLSELEKNKTEVWSRLRECSEVLNRWGIAHNPHVVWM